MKITLDTKREVFSHDKFVGHSSVKYDEPRAFYLNNRYLRHFCFWIGRVSISIAWRLTKYEKLNELGCEDFDAVYRKLAQKS